MTNEGLLSPVPEFYAVREEDRNGSEKKLPEFDEQDYSSKLDQAKCHPSTL